MAMTDKTGVAVLGPLVGMGGQQRGKFRLDRLLDQAAGSRTQDALERVR